MDPPPGEWDVDPLVHVNSGDAMSKESVALGADFRLTKNFNCPRDPALRDEIHNDGKSYSVFAKSHRLNVHGPHDTTGNVVERICLEHRFHFRKEGDGCNESSDLCAFCVACGGLRHDCFRWVILLRCRGHFGRCLAHNAGPWATTEDRPPKPLRNR